jgi:tetratricopeptide (TPR) repeat protein
MSTLIYCANSIAATPYYIEEISLNVYSLEELSYYMLNNVYLLSSKLMNQELCNWIGRELKCTKLANELLAMVQNNSPLHIFVGHILNSNGYSSNKEIKDALSIIATFENKSEAERKKLRADRLMAKGKYVDAIYEYETLLSDDLSKTMPRVVEGNVYHNLGCAFAKLFFFDEASKCFDEGYKRNQNKQTLYHLLYSLRCAKDKFAFDEYVNKYQVPRADVEEVLQIVSRATVKEDIVGFDSSINDLLYGDKSEEAKATINNVISNWKKEYIKTCRI